MEVLHSWMEAVAGVGPGQLTRLREEKLPGVARTQFFLMLLYLDLTSQVAHESGTHEMLTISSSSLQDPPSPIPSITHSSSALSLPEQATLSVARRPSSTLTFNITVEVQTQTLAQ